MMKEIKIDTNFNSKLDLPEFVHISFAPLNPVSESELKEAIVINVKDGSHDPVICQLHDMARCQLLDVREEDTMHSYGLSAYDFIDWWLQKYPSSNACTEMAVYFYRKINEADLKVEQKELFAA